MNRATFREAYRAKRNGSGARPTTHGYTRAVADALAKLDGCVIVPGACYRTHHGAVMNRRFHLARLHLRSIRRHMRMAPEHREAWLHAARGMLTVMRRCREAGRLTATPRLP